MTDKNDRYTIVEKECNIYTNAIINSSSEKKIVVAGPGTGKTYLFKRILEGKTNALTLTFVRALVEELSLELFGKSEVKTLHGFALSKLYAKSSKVKLFPKLPIIIKEDAKILLGEVVDFEYMFHNRDDGNELLKFYKKRKDYYGEFYGFSDIIFALVKYLEDERELIPEYDFVLVDEFQDFNLLEISLINLLSEKSPILLAGDDDQALYGGKSASASHIREKFSDNCLEYESFTLPYCRRCTRVIVGAVNDIIRSAHENGLLQDRIKKKYIYYDEPNKDVESDKYPKIVFAKYYENQF